jgi:single-strand DNA-binding protein
MRLPIATNDRFKNRAGDFVEETVWHNIVAWEGNGIPDFHQIHTGTPLTVIAKLKPVQYTAKAGIEKMTYEIVPRRSFLQMNKGRQFCRKQQP